jgi:nitroreductase
MTSVIDAIRSRHAVRQFDPRPVPDEVLHTILDAGRRAQSSKNTQPWEFVVVRDRDTLTALSKTGDFAQHLAGATFAVVLVGSAQTTWNSFDLGQAAAFLQLAATDLGVGSCIAAIYRPDEARQILNIPEGKNLFCAISFGYPAADFKPLKLGGRKPIDDLVHWEKWE